MGRISWGKISARYACTSTFGNLLICRSICMRNCNLDAIFYRSPAVIREKSKCEGKDHSILAFNTSNRAPSRRKGSEQLLVLPWTLNDRKKFSRVNLLLTINERYRDQAFREQYEIDFPIYRNFVNFSNHSARNRTSSNL